MLHHLGPVLIALSWPGETIALGMPPSCAGASAPRPLRRPCGVLQRPVVGRRAVRGPADLWLIPSVPFRAMLDWLLYAIMNASMVIDGLLFWFLVLDPRPVPQASIGFFPRLALAFLIIFPQIGDRHARSVLRDTIFILLSRCAAAFFRTSGRWQTSRSVASCCGSPLV